MRKHTSETLTAEEVDFLKSGKVDELVRRYTARNQENIGTWASAYRKVAAAARAEREALEEVTRLAIAKGEAATLIDQQSEIESLRRRAQALEVKNRELETGLHRALAAPSMAVHSDD